MDVSFPPKSMSVKERRRSSSSTSGIGPVGAEFCAVDGYAYVEVSGDLPLSNGVNDEGPGGADAIRLGLGRIGIVSRGGWRFLITLEYVSAGLCGWRIC